MPSPFPGMDPFIESLRWADFHHSMICVIREALIPRVRPRYVVRIEERVYVERTAAAGHRATEFPARPEATAAANLAAESTRFTLPMPERQREAFLTIQLRETMEVVTVVEVLSPTNKRRGSDGRREYIEKWEAVLQSPASRFSMYS